MRIQAIQLNKRGLDLLQLALNRLRIRPGLKKSRKVAVVIDVRIVLHLGIQSTCPIDCLRSSDLLCCRIQRTGSGRLRFGLLRGSGCHLRLAL